MPTAAYNALITRIENGERILIDGATGTECERRGVPHVMNIWNSGAALSHPEIVRTIHEEYIECGAEMIITNTFSSSRHAMRSAGIEDRFESLTRAAVQLAQDARRNQGKPEVLIAGGITHWIWTDNPPSLKELEENSKDQAMLMAEGGCDLIVLEMLSHIDKLIACIDGAAAAGLPVWAGLSLKPINGEMRLLGGESLIEAVRVIKDKNVPLINIMHTEVEHIEACLDILQTHWQGKIGVYAHTCRFEGGNAVFDDNISPEDYKLNSKKWLARGVQVIGGCCGVRREHICNLQSLVNPHQ
ncbi:MAG: homocysteine S-methyltransferase family protein [Acidiferrobacterales bacterium]|nr:homocysteine S-methyltransferase family protein [Acidiferrobacterales bacterium]